MNHNTILILLWVTFILGTISGFYLFYLWCKRKWTSIKNAKSLDKIFFLTFPGLFVLILPLFPTIYFNYLLKQEIYCITIIQVNKDIQKNDPFLIERCNCLNIDELFEKAKLTTEEEI